MSIWFWCSHSSCRSCDAWYKFDGVISVLGRASVICKNSSRTYFGSLMQHSSIGTLTLRTYAVFRGSRRILYVLAPLGLMCVILDIVSHRSNFDSSRKLPVTHQILDACPRSRVCPFYRQSDVRVNISQFPVTSKYLLESCLHLCYSGMCGSKPSSFIVVEWLYTAANILSIAMVVFEWTAAILTWIGCILAVRVNGHWRWGSAMLHTLLFRQGLWP